jgi:hypothetical protein
MSFTLVEKYQQLKQGSIAIRPYFDKSMSNMGLEEYGLSLYDGVFHEEQLACIEMNGIKRYVSGLNEFAPEVLLLPEEARTAKQKEIRILVAELEKQLVANILDPKDKDFWNKVRLLKPDNDEFWGKIAVRAGNEPVFLDPGKDVYDLIKLMAIEAGGFSLVARSYDEARSAAVPPKFFLDKYQETVSTTNELKKIKNKAVVSLQNLFDTNSTKLLYVAKVVDTNSVQYKKSTPNDVVYDNMDRFISGEGSEKNKKRAAEQFTSTCELDMETLKLRALIKDATFYKYIAIKSDGFIYHTESNTMMGRNSTDVLEYLKNPLNDQILDRIMKPVEKQWAS